MGLSYKNYVHMGNYHRTQPSNRHVSEVKSQPAEGSFQSLPAVVVDWKGVSLCFCWI